MKNIINIILCLLLVFLLGLKITLVVDKSSKINHEIAAVVANSDVAVDSSINEFTNNTNDSYIVVSYKSESVIDQSKIYIHDQNNTVKKYNSIEKGSINNYLDGNMLIYSNLLDIYTTNLPYPSLLINTNNLVGPDYSRLLPVNASCEAENDT
jgi:hypothetical protein